MTRTSSRRKGTPVVVEGVHYRSTYEGAVAKALLDDGVEFQYEKLRVRYFLPKIYIPDFTVTTESGREIIIEAKGWFAPEDKRKMLAVKRWNPELDIRLLFQGPTPGDKRWANEHEFWWAKGPEVPREWLSE